MSSVRIHRAAGGAGRAAEEVSVYPVYPLTGLRERGAVQIRLVGKILGQQCEGGKKGNDINTKQKSFHRKKAGATQALVGKSKVSEKYGMRINVAFSGKYQRSTKERNV